MTHLFVVRNVNIYKEVNAKLSCDINLRPPQALSSPFKTGAALHMPHAKPNSTRGDLDLCAVCLLIRHYTCNHCAVCVSLHVSVPTL